MPSCRILLKTEMTNTIHICRLALRGNHGVMPQERVVGAMFYVSLDADVEVAPEAYIEDKLEGTVSYADIIACIREEMNVPACLIEHLLYRVGRRVFNDFPSIKALRLRIDKENPPCGVCVDNIGVTVCMTR